jgi:hypothetical protein
MSKATGICQGDVTARQLSRLLLSGQHDELSMNTESHPKSNPTSMVLSGSSQAANKDTLFFSVHTSACAHQAKAHILSCLKFDRGSQVYASAKGRIVESDFFFSITTFAPLRLRTMFMINMHQPKNLHGAYVDFQRNPDTGSTEFLPSNGRAPIAVSGRALMLSFRCSGDVDGKLRFSLIDVASGHVLALAVVPSTGAPIVNIVTTLSDCPAADKPATYKAGPGCAAQVKILHASVTFDPSVGAAAASTVNAAPMAAEAGAGAGGGGAGAGR